MKVVSTDSKRLVSASMTESTAGLKQQNTRHLQIRPNSKYIMCDPEPTLYPLERLERVERLERTDPCDERTGAIEPFDRTPTSDF